MGTSGVREAGRVYNSVLVAALATSFGYFEGSRGSPRHFFYLVLSNKQPFPCPPSMTVHCNHIKPDLFLTSNSF